MSRLNVLEENLKLLNRDLLKASADLEELRQTQIHVKEAITKEKRKKVEDPWVPSNKEVIYILTDSGNVFKDEWGSYSREMSFRQGNIFKTRDQAENEKDRRAILHKMRQAAIKSWLDLSLYPNYFADTRKYCIRWNKFKGLYVSFAYRTYDLNNIYFATEESADFFLRENRYTLGKLFGRNK